MVYSDFVEYGLVGHGMFPLLDRITYTGSSDIRHQELWFPLIRTVNGQYFDKIRFKIGDGNGRAPVWLSPSTPTILALQFTPQSDGYSEKVMDQTFVSNQSRVYFPENKATKFTAVLPAQQNLQDINKWRVGCTKITIPPAMAVTKLSQSEWVVHLEPSFAIPASAQTSITIGKFKNYSELILEFNTKMKSIITSWFPADKEQAGVGGSSSTDRELQYYDAIDDQDYSTEASLDKLKNGVGLDMDELSTFTSHFVFRGSSTDNTKFQVSTIASNSPDASFTTLENDHGLFRRLGFSYYQTTTEMNSKGLVLHFYAQDPPFVGESNEVFLLGCKMKLSTTKNLINIHTSFFNNDGRDHSVTLSLPEGMYDVLGMNKQGVPQHERQNEQIYLSTLVKQGHVFPHDLSNKKTLIRNVASVVQECSVNPAAIPVNSDTNYIEIQQRSPSVEPLSKLAHLTCSLVNFQQIGDRRLPLMEVISMSSTSAGAAHQVKQYVFEPKHIKYYPLVKSTFQNITFEIKDEEGGSIPFVDDGIATITVRFKKL